MRDRLAIATLSSREIMLPFESSTQGAPCPGMRRSNHQGTLIFPDGFFDPTAIPEHVPQVEVSFRQIRIQFEGSAKAGGRVVESARMAQRFAEIGVSGGVVRPELERALDVLDRRGVVSTLVSGYSQVVHRLHMLGLETEDLPVKRFRFRQPPSLMVLER